jgi:hypothetical protein
MSWVFLICVKLAKIKVVEFEVKLVFYTVIRSEVKNHDLKGNTITSMKIHGRFGVEETAYEVEMKTLAYTTVFLDLGGLKGRVTWQNLA